MHEVIKEIQKTEKEFITLRHQIHMNPEVGFEEVETSALVASKLKEWGYDVNVGLAKTGVVGTMKVGDGKKIIGLRADLDALPIQEETGKEWSSKNSGKFHGCGHDGHTTMLLCAAKYLSETKNFNGTVHLIFQPAEELLYGGEVMLKDGVFEKFPCDKIFGLHNMPGLKTGEMYFRAGPMFASSDTIQIEITGVGSHGAQPEKGIDATLVACHIGVALQSIVSRNVSPFEAAVITVGCIESGNAPNVVNGSAIMKLTVRSLNKEIRALLLKRINEVAELQAKSFGATAVVNHLTGSPVLVNGKEANDFAIQVAEKLFGADKVHKETNQLMGSEDFAFMLEANPNGAYAMIGGGVGAEFAPVHNPKFDFNDQCIVPGAAYWVGLTEEYLK